MVTSPIQNTSRQAQTHTAWAPDRQAMHCSLVRQPEARTNWPAGGDGCGPNPRSHTTRGAVIIPHALGGAFFFFKYIYLFYFIFSAVAFSPSIKATSYLSKRQSVTEAVAAVFWRQRWLSRMSWQQPQRGGARRVWRISCGREPKLTGRTALDDPPYRSVSPDEHFLRFITTPFHLSLNALLRHEPLQMTASTGVHM